MPKLTKAVVDGLRPREKAYVEYDTSLSGFGVRVNPTGKKAWIIEYRAHGGGSAAPVRRYSFARVGEVTPEEARKEAGRLLHLARHGQDPLDAREELRTAPTLSELARRFLAEHMEAKRKKRTGDGYRTLLEGRVLPKLGSRKAREIKRQDIAALHHGMRETPYAANRMLAAVSSLYTWASKVGQVPEGLNPARSIDKYPETKRERYLTGEELERLGATLALAETEGLPWRVNETGPKAKHLAKPENRSPTVYSPYVTAAIRLLILTGCRLREILHLRWSEVDFERGLLLLEDSKTGRKAVLLGAPAIRILSELPRDGEYVIAGQEPGKPRADLKKPWAAISAHAGLSGVRLHDLRHTFASVGAASGLTLPLIGKLLGHSQISTTQRYAHLADDPVRRAADLVSAQVEAGLMGQLGRGASVVPFAKARA